MCRFRQIMTMNTREKRDQRTYIAIDMKSFYASVECVYRKLDPLRANLLVADPSRSDQTICLAVSPALKAIGVPGRPRLFEAKQAIRRYEKKHHTKIYYETAVPRMAEYERVSALIYSVYLRYAAPRTSMCIPSTRSSSTARPICSSTATRRSASRGRREARSIRPM